MPAPTAADSMEVGCASASERRATPARLRPIRLAGTAILLTTVAAYAGSTIARSAGEGGRSVLWDDWIYNWIAVLAAALVLTRVLVDRQDRRVWALIGAALVAQSVAQAAYSADAAGIGRPVTTVLSGVGVLA